MPNGTARFTLPFILPGQAQKELFHNEALILADALLHASVEEAGRALPPPEPDPGQCWIVASGAEGAWASHENALAIWTEGGWRFAVPSEGMCVWNKSAGTWLLRSDGTWRSGEVPATKLIIDGEQVVGPRQPSVASPSGGTIIDAEARTALDAVIVALRTHGLID